MMDRFDPDKTPFTEYITGDTAGLTTVLHTRVIDPFHPAITCNVCNEVTIIHSENSNDGVDCESVADNLHGSVE